VNGRPAVALPNNKSTVSEGKQGKPSPRRGLGKRTKVSELMASAVGLPREVRFLKDCFRHRCLAWLGIYNLKVENAMLRLSAITFLLLLSVAAAGCRAGAEPRLRFGCYPTSTVGTTFLDPKDLGAHGYRSNSSEKNGIVYTCKAGHVDITHLRIAADWTAFLTRKSFECLMESNKEFSFKFKPEPSRYFVRITYGENWEIVPRKFKEPVAREVSLAIGQYLAYTATTWHEILTWFDYKCIAFFPEYPSAFSWEDSFSNLLGTYIAAQAIRDTKHKFDEAMTFAIDRELEKLDVQSSHTARLASKKVRGKWYSGRLLYFVDMKKRNFDIGLDDGFATPTLVPGLSKCRGVEPQPYPAPNLDSLSRYGFSIHLEIEPVVWEKNKILRIVYPYAGKRKKRLEPAIHFARIMNYIRKDAAKKYGHK